jgi:hypothetical protein
MAAAEFDFATILGDGTKSCAELAAQTHTQPDWVYRILKSLSIDGIFSEHAERCFSNTEASNLLRDIPGSARSIILLLNTSYFRASFEQLCAVARTGQAGHQILGWPPFYAHLQEYPRENALFEEAIAALADTANETIASSYPFPAGARVADIGGGQGNLLHTIQQHYTIKAAIFDFPGVIEQVRKADALSLELVAGNIFSDPLPEADVYIFRDIFHCFGDHDCAAIIANCRRSMPEQSKILVIEQPFDVPALAAGVDLIMGTVFGGKQRSDQEWENLFAPLRLARRFLTASPFVIWEFSLATAI